jgi:hypothetical protein
LLQIITSLDCAEADDGNGAAATAPAGDVAAEGSAAGGRQQQHRLPAEGEVRLVAATRLPQQEGCPARFTLAVPRIDAYFTGTGARRLLAPAARCCLLLLLLLLHRPSTCPCPTFRLSHPTALPTSRLPTFRLNFAPPPPTPPPPRSHTHHRHPSPLPLPAGDLLAALLLANMERSPGRLANAVELAVAALQGVLRATAAAAGPGHLGAGARGAADCRARELRLVQNLHHITRPAVYSRAQPL